MKMTFFLEKILQIMLQLVQLCHILFLCLSVTQLLTILAILEFPAPHTSLPINLLLCQELLKKWRQFDFGETLAVL